MQRKIIYVFRKTPTKGWSKDCDPKALEIVRKIANKHKSH